MKCLITKQIRALASTIVPVVFCVLTTGCASVETKMADTTAFMSKPLPPGQARIFFTRQASMLGAIATHHVMDCGSNLNYDSKVIEKGQIEYGETNSSKSFNYRGTVFTDQNNNDIYYKKVIVTDTQNKMEVNKGYVWNVKYLVLPRALNTDCLGNVMSKDVAEENNRKSRETRLELLCEPEFDGLALNTKMGRVQAFVDNGKEVVALGWTGYPLMLRDGVKVLATASDATERIQLNARYIGSVGSGGVLIFERPAGSMRLKVITAGGDESFAPEFKIEEGKRYDIEYSYGFSGINFSIREQP